jgi:hypothetical protein
MAITTFIPLTWKNMDLKDPLQVGVLQKQLADWANQAQSILGSAAGLAGVLNGSSSVSGNSLNYVIKNLGTVTTDQTVNCANAAGVSISITMTTTNVRLTMTNLDLGVPVQIVFINNSGGANRTLQISASTPGGTSYNVRGKIAGTAIAITDWGTTGIAIGAGLTYIFYGTSVTSSGNPFLYLPAF